MRYQMNEIRFMKKLICCTMLLTLMLLYGCSNDTVPTLSVGKYVLEGTDEVIAPYVLLDDDQRFVFMYSVLSSHLPQGIYSVDGDKLILTADGDQAAYVFEIEDKAIAFVADESATIPSFSEQTSVVDGDHFTLIDEG